MTKFLDPELCITSELLDTIRQLQAHKVAEFKCTAKGPDQDALCGHLDDESTPVRCVAWEINTAIFLLAQCPYSAMSQRIQKATDEGKDN